MALSISIEFLSSSEGEQASRLLKEATALKDQGKFDEAVANLRTAYEQIARTSIDYTVNVFLRLPLYLQAGHRNDEAWREFNNLLTAGYPNMPNTDWAWHYMESSIYDKTRLFLQREKRLVESVRYGALSVITMIRAELAKPHDRFWDPERVARLQSKAFLSARLAPLLSRAKLQDRHDSALAVLCEWSNTLPDVDDTEYETRLVQSLQLR